MHVHMIINFSRLRAFNRHVRFNKGPIPAEQTITSTRSRLYKMELEIGHAFQSRLPSRSQQCCDISLTTNAFALLLLAFVLLEAAAWRLLSTPMHGICTVFGGAELLFTLKMVLAVELTNSALVASERVTVLLPKSSACEVVAADSAEHPFNFLL